MFTEEKAPHWSSFGLKVAIASTVLTVAFIVAHVVLGLADYKFSLGATGIVLSGIVGDFRYLSEQLILVGAILFVGGKFLETRTTLTIGFSNASDMRIKGPDDDNVVWVGHRYASRLEAEAMAGAIESRIKAS